MDRSDKIALLLSLLGSLAALLVAELVFERMPHIEDEIAYVWQARALTLGHLTLPSPPHAKSFLVPFVVDYHGQRFGKYPPGWPLALAIGESLGLRDLVNPLLAGLGVWLTYRLGRRIFGAGIGLLAAGLTVSSPFFLINSASLLSHPLGLVLSASFALGWLAGFSGTSLQPGWKTTLGVSLAYGGLVITRPFTAFALALPFAIQGLYLFVAGGGVRTTQPDDARRKLRLHLVTLGALMLLLSGLHFLWQYAVTGDPFLNPYTLWWSYDQVGFGPGHGVTPEGHNLIHAYVNTLDSLMAGSKDLFGWGAYSWIFLPFGIWAARHNDRALLVGSLFPTLVVVYLSYWTGSSLFGPRYFYEALFGLTIFTAAGIVWLAGWFPSSGAPASTASPMHQRSYPEVTLLRNPLMGGIGRVFERLRRAGFNAREFLPKKIRIYLNRRWVTGVVVLALLAYNLLVFLPNRMGGLFGLNDMTRSGLRPFRTPEYAPALIIVHTGMWMPYGALLDLEDPLLTTPFIFALSRGIQNDSDLAADFLDRSIYHYYPDDPYTFYTAPRPEQ
jgi:hypothetical protein